jgi:hypothetical protein
MTNSIFFRYTILTPGKAGKLHLGPGRIIAVEVVCPSWKSASTISKSEYFISTVRVFII